MALVLAYVIAPGAGEIIENVAHYLLDGHAAHAAHEDADQTPHEDAHGCSGPFQTCPCHGTSAFVADSPPIEVGFAHWTRKEALWFVSVYQSDGAHSTVFRPPIS
jgi:hypothetical protein